MFLLYCALVTTSSLCGENLDQLAACLWCVYMFLMCLCVMRSLCVLFTTCPWSVLFTTCFFCALLLRFSSMFFQITFLCIVCQMSRLYTLCSKFISCSSCDRWLVYHTRSSSEAYNICLLFSVFCLTVVPGLCVFCRISMPCVWSYPPLIHSESLPMMGGMHIHYI